MKVAKAVAAAVGTVATAVSAALADDLFGVDEIGHVVATVITAALAVYAVWRVPNIDPVPDHGGF